MRMAPRRKNSSTGKESLNRREFLASTAGIFSAIAAFGVLLVARPSHAAPPVAPGRIRRRIPRDELSARNGRIRRKKKAVIRKK